MLGLALSGSGIDIIREELEHGAPPARLPGGWQPPTDLHGMHLLFWVVGLAATCAVIRAILNYVYSMEVARLVFGKIVVRLRSDLFEKLHRMDFRFFDEMASGSIFNRVTGDVQSVRMFVDAVLIQSVILVLSLLVYLVYMLSIAPGLTLACLATTPILVFLSGWFASKTRPAYLESRRRTDVLIRILTETIRGIAAVKGFSRENAEAARFDRANDAVLVSQSAVFGTVSLFNPLINTVTHLNLTILLAYGGWLVIHNQLALGAGLVVFAGVLQQFSGQVSMVASILNTAQQSLAAATRIFDILDAPIRVKDKPDAIPCGPLAGRIEFENVRVLNAGRTVLDLPRLEIPAGRCLGVVGQTGAGKSVLLSLIPRFSDPDEGSVRVDGLDLRDVTLASLRRQIGVVFQDNFLFSTTVASNIAFGHPEATREQIEHAARAAAADEFIRALPDGYQTVLREGGDGLSGGQRQRIAIARALLLNPPILILDDPTSALDAETEEHLRDTFRSAARGRTVLLVSHRIATLALADEIVVLEAGRVTQRGTLEELSSQAGYFRKAANLQLTGIADER